MEYKLSAACTCHMGRIRKNNEDNLYFNGKILEKDNTGLRRVESAELSSKEKPCFGVFDGMGGEAWGEVASWLAADTMQKQMKEAQNYIYQPSDLLKKLIDQMNLAVCDGSQERMSERMGSTAVMFYFDEDFVYQCNLGDSKAFRLRDNGFEQMSKNHTDEEFLKENNIERKPRLTQHLGIMPDELTLEPYVVKGDIKLNDKYLLCSDGLTDMVTNIEICEVLSRPLPVSEIVSILLEKALAAGGRDNVTIMVISVEEV